MSASTSLHETEAVLFMTLVQLVVIILAARGANALARRLGQPGVIGEVIAGLMLGPSLLGLILPGLSEALFASTPPSP